MTQETPTEHSDLVGGSTASRRLNCPRSYALEKKAPKSKGSAYAREGTALHEMIALVLDKNMDPAEMLPFTHKQPEKHGEPAWELTIDEETWDRLGQPALDMFDAFLDELEADQDGAPANYMIEERGEFPGIPGAFGTSDVPFRCGKIGGIWDWKFGRRHVSAEDNDQLMFYFASLREKYPDYFKDTDRVMLCISQPQCNDQEPETWETTHEDIDNFILDLQDAINEAQQPDAHIEKGKWCDFADCKTVCPLHVGAAVKLGEKMAELEEKKRPAHPEPHSDAAKEEAAEHADEMATFLSDAMELAEMAESWAKHIAGITQERLEDGQPVEGWKIVAKSSSGREWTADDDVVVRRLQSRGLKAADYYNKKVITPPAAEKLLKKLGKELPDDIVRKKPSSGYTLTRDGDPRPEAATPKQKAQALGEALLKATK